MGVISDAAVSKGDIMKRLDALEDEVDRLRHARRLEAAAVGRGGLRVHSGGGITLEDGGSLLVNDGGDVIVQGGRLVALDADGDLVFQVTTDPASIFMRQELISELQKGIFAEGIHSASAPSTVSTTSTSYVALTGGPTVSDVEVSATGRALVNVTGLVTAEQIGDGTTVGYLSFQVSGATTRSPQDLEARQQLNRLSGSGGLIIDVAGNASTQVLLTGLNEGSHTFEARYKSFDGTTVEFSNRILTITAF